MVLYARTSKAEFEFYFYTSIRIITSLGISFGLISRREADSVFEYYDSIICVLFKQYLHACMYDVDSRGVAFQFK